MIKKFILFTMLVFTLISCKDDNSIETNSSQSTTFKLNADLHQELLNQYSFNEINVKVYENENDWINESNEIFSGNLDNNGTIQINDIGIIKGNHYIDMFTNDMKWNNWGDNEFEASLNSTKFIVLGIKPFVGEWNLSDIDKQGDETLIRTPLSLSIQKDFKVNFTDNVNGNVVTIEYDITNITSSSQFKMQINENYENNLEYIYPTEWYINYAKEFDFIIMPNISINDNSAIDYIYTKE